MKITVVGPSPEYQDYAGPKIRYRRLIPELSGRGAEIEIRDIAQFDPRSADCDILLISKCHDPRAMVSAAIAGDRGILVGVDIFDDYFSQHHDSRLSRFRTWLKQLLPLCDFALCSTPATADVISAYRPGTPTLVMNDPGPMVDIPALAESLSRKAASARDSGRIRIGWFGVGDNPFFQVGLEDLAAFGGMLQPLRQSGMDVELRILTNVRSLSADGLAFIRQLPLRTSVGEWSENGEQALLEDSLLVFLPVNSSRFSAAKSLNRAVTALSAGCQVLSAGHPLYAPLDPHIYRDPLELAHDIGGNSLRLRPETLGTFAAAIETYASAQTEATRLLTFLSGLNPRTVEGPQLALVHGHSTNGAAHKLVQAAGGLSVASPACSAELGFDLIFGQAAGRLTMFISAKARRRLSPERQEDFRPAGTINGRKFFAKAFSGEPPRLAEQRNPSFVFQLATYSDYAERIAAEITGTFGECRIIYSETSPLPFRPAA